MNTVELAYMLRDHITAGTRDGNVIWFDPDSVLGSLLVTTPKHGNFSIAAVLEGGTLTLSQRLTVAIMNICPRWHGLLGVDDGGCLVLTTLDVLMPGALEEGIPWPAAHADAMEVAA